MRSSNVARRGFLLAIWTEVQKKKIERRLLIKRKALQVLCVFHSSIASFSRSVPITSCLHYLFMKDMRNEVHGSGDVPLRNAQIKVWRQPRRRVSRKVATEQ